MAEIKHVVIFPHATTLPAGLQEALKAKGLSSAVCVGEGEAVKAIGSSDESVLLVYCSNTANLDDVTAKLSTQTPLHSTPLIIVGTDVDRYESFLNRFFILATTITLPCDNVDIVSAVKYVSRYLEKVRSRKVAEAATIVKSEAESYQKLFGGFATIPALAFAKLKELDLFDKEIGGETYAMMFRPQEADEKYFLPDSSKVCKFIKSIEESLPRDRASRYMRIALLTHHILTALGFSGERLEYGKQAAVLYSAGVFEQSKNLTQEQYLIGDKEILRKEICSRIKDSLLSFDTVIEEEQTRKIILLLAKLIGQEDALDNSPECLAASAIATADAIDRVIYQRNVFQPVGAYSILSILRKQEFSFIHPLVLGVIVKLLAEAVSSNISIMNKSHRLKHVTQLINAADDIDEAIVTGDAQQVPIGNLEPGMRLTSKGIHTEDGKSLISESIELDQDIIWRLWQLSAVRPLQKKVQIEKN